MSNRVTKIDDHTAQALARRPDVMQEKLRYQQLIESLTIAKEAIDDPVPKAWQELENVFFDLLLKRSLTHEFNDEDDEDKQAIGAQLDGIGRVLCLDRYTDQTDDAYRSDLKGWVRFLFSQGEPETLIFVLDVLTDPVNPIQLIEFFPGTVVLEFDGTVLNEDNLVSIMDRCAAAGVKIWLTLFEDPAFRFDGDPGEGFDDGVALTEGMFAGLLGV